MHETTEAGRDVETLRERISALSAAALRITASLDVTTVLQEAADSAHTCAMASMLFQSTEPLEQVRPVEHRSALRPHAGKKRRTPERETTACPWALPAPAGANLAKGPQTRAFPFRQTPRLRA